MYVIIKSSLFCKGNVEMTKKEKMDKKADKKADVLGRIQSILVVLLIMLIVVFVGLLWFIFDKFGRVNFNDGKVETDVAGVVEDDGQYLEGEFDGLEAVEGAPKIPSMRIYSSTDVQNILLIGTDERGKKFSDRARSDSMMIL